MEPVKIRSLNDVVEHMGKVIVATATRRAVCDADTDELKWFSVPLSTPIVGWLIGGKVVIERSMVHPRTSQSYIATDKRVLVIVLTTWPCCEPIQVPASEVRLAEGYELPTPPEWYNDETKVPRSGA